MEVTCDAVMPTSYKTKAEQVGQHDTGIAVAADQKTRASVTKKRDVCGTSQNRRRVEEKRCFKRFDIGFDQPV
jgi:hypothetical protein